MNKRNRILLSFAFICIFLLAGSASATIFPVNEAVMVGKEPMPSLLVSDMSPAEGDGVITPADALYLAKYLVGKEAAP